MYDCIMYLRICINLGGEILVFYRVVRPASVWQQVCVIRVRFLTNWMKRLAWSAVADTLTPELLRWWWRQIVTLWHDVREMFRLEAGCRTRRGHQGNYELDSDTRVSSHHSSDTCRMGHSSVAVVTQWEVRIEEHPKCELYDLKINWSIIKSF